MTITSRDRVDLLASLRLPDRYEPLHEAVGDGIANILVAPAEAAQDDLSLIIDAVRAGQQGTLVPLSGPSGAGKTTFAASANQWKAKDFTSTVQYTGAITFDALAASIANFRKGLAQNDNRVIPINVDHRESAPPTVGELAEIKRFLRTPPGGVPAVIFWPETNAETAATIGDRYEEIAGAQPAKILRVEGPPRETWVDIALNTLRLTNQVDSLGSGLIARRAR